MPLSWRIWGVLKTPAERMISRDAVAVPGVLGVSWEESGLAR